jgi:5-(carboxyamino)imidazole ribonucleotide mutase/phosphoribosylaminoimidazole-succinocarboxamide synthase
MPGRVVIIMGSASDLEHVDKIVAQLEAFGIPATRHVASAHKSVHHLLETLARYEDEREPLVYITVAGRSNALGGMVDANTVHPVITCPPVSSTFAGADIYSSLRMPSGVAPTLVLDPAGAALAAAKIIGLCDKGLAQRVAAHQASMTEAIVAADRALG